MSVVKQEFDLEEDDIRYKVIYKKLDGEDVWVKKKPKQPEIKPSGIMFIFPDNTQHHWEVIDAEGHEIDRYYMKGYDGTPSFYVSGATNWFRIEADNPEDMKVQIIPLTDLIRIETKKSGNFYGIETEAPGWFIFLKKQGTNIQVTDIEKMK